MMFASDHEWNPGIMRPPTLPSAQLAPGQYQSIVAALTRRPGTLRVPRELGANELEAFRARFPNMPRDTYSADGSAEQLWVDEMRSLSRARTQARKRRRGYIDQGPDQPRRRVRGHRQPGIARPEAEPGTTAFIIG